MADLRWCPNCNQKVAPQRPASGNKGCVFVLLVLVGIAMLFTGVLFIPGIFVLCVAGLYFIVGIATELGGLFTKSHCPICKGTNLG